MAEKHRIFITGAAGYVGMMLAQEFASRNDVAALICLDKEEKPELLRNSPKIVWITSNTSDASWRTQVSAHNPDTVIHTAWQIREMYGNKKLQWKWNIEGSDAVFDFAFNTPTVRKLIHFSTVASYGAYPTNTIEHRFTEEEPFRKSDYLYAEEKRIVEEHLKEKFENKKDSRPQVVIIRPAAITGPRGRYMRIRFGLQAALSGQLKESLAHRLVSFMVSFVPVTSNWCRQFIHEDDVVAIITKLVFDSLKSEYEIFNICPPGPVVRGRDMARAVHKRLILVPPLVVRMAFSFFWHASRGRIPTSRGGWKSYSYPIAVDGSKLTRMYGYEYQHQSLNAFRYTRGRYEQYVPEELRVPRVKQKILVTGGAGFIGSHLIHALLDAGHEVVCVDNVNGYYDPALKEARLKRFEDRVKMYRTDITDLEALDSVFRENQFDKIAHLAAQAGVRYSLDHPHAYAFTNYVGTLNIFELCKKYGPKDIVFASTSSIYGQTKRIPFVENDPVGKPMSIYAASKRAAELLAASYVHLFDLNVTALRFFTVYGPWGRPDMALFKFTKNIIEGKPIDVYNNGDMLRDFTYVSDIVEGFRLALEKQPAGYAVFNLGNGTPVKLMDFVHLIEKELGKKADINFMPLQPGDVPKTYADISKARRMLGFSPSVSVQEGVKNFIEWYRMYHLH